MTALLPLMHLILPILMSLPNRVFPDGTIHALPLRGLWLGNRGGRFHHDNQTLRHKKYASKQWIYCVLEFKNRQREVMTKGYTELFFADEASALASGHRPCFECQREKAKAFARFWRAENPPRVKEMDAILHEERLKLTPAPDKLPPHAMIKVETQFYIKTAEGFELWQWGKRTPATPDLTKALLLTPPSIIKVLERGFHAY
jgi:hypothetical protein